MATDEFYHQWLRNGLITKTKERCNSLFCFCNSFTEHSGRGSLARTRVTPIKSCQLGVCLKISEPKSLGSAGGRAKTKPPFRPPRLACPTEAVRRREAEAERTILSFSLVANSKPNPFSSPQILSCQSHPWRSVLSKHPARIFRYGEFHEIGR